MELVDLIVGIVVVTILVTVVVGLITYVAYKLRLARQPDRTGEAEGTRYFYLHEPPEEDDGGEPTGGSEAGDAGSGAPGPGGRGAAPDDADGEGRR